MKLKLLIGGLVFLIIVNLATLGTWVYFRLQEPEPRLLEHRERGARSQINPRHRQDMRRLLHDFRESTRPLRDRLDSLEAVYFREMAEEKIDSLRTDSLLRKMADTRLLMSREATKMIIQTREMLSPREQAYFFRLVMESHPGHHRARREKDVRHRRNSGPGH